jgi:hypothetical protein
MSEAELLLLTQRHQRLVRELTAIRARFDAVRPMRLARLLLWLAERLTAAAKRLE